MPRWAVYDNATGRMVSESALQPTNLPAGLATKQIPDSDAGVMWDEATRSMVTRPPKVIVDRLSKLQADPRFTSFNTTQRQRILDLLNEFFGDVRTA